MFNGQSAYVAVTSSTSYISAYSLTATAGGERRYEPVINSIEPGITTSIQATASADRKYVTLTIKPTVTQLLRLEREPFAAGPADKDALSIQRPVIDVQSLQTTVSLPDRGTLLISAGGVDKGRALLILMRPTLIIQREVEPDAFPLLEPK